MKKKILIIAANGFEDVELVGVRDMLLRNGHEVEMAFKTETEFVKSTYGLKFFVDLTLTNALNRLKNYDALFIPGGVGNVDQLDYSNEIDQILEHFNSNNKPIGAICAAPIILAKRGYLKNKRAICFPDKKFQTVLIKNGASLEAVKCSYDQECSVVSDNNIMTGLDFKTALKFGEQFSKFIEKK